MRKSIYLSIFLPCLWACTKPFELNLERDNMRLVVEGGVYSTPGPYMVRLTLSRNSLSSRSSLDNVKPVSDATVVISDNFGNIDTLVAPPDSISGYAKIYRLVGDSLVLDSFYRTTFNSFTRKDGYYQTTNLIGVPGRTYFLKVIHGQKEYNAQETMLPVPKIDSVRVGIKYSIKENIPYRVARLYFSEPQQQTNYYLAPTWNGSGIDEDVPFLFPIASARQCFQAIIFDDRLLGPFVNGIFVDETCAKEQVPSDKIFDWGNTYLLSLSQQHYLYLKTLFDQLKSDGGAYKPTPANPPSNLSNGALGYFGASAVSRKFYFFR